MPSQTLFSWPATPAVAGFQFLSRSVLLFNNMIGVSLCFPAGTVSFLVAGSFMAFSLFPISVLLNWNFKELRKIKTNSNTRSHGGVGGYEQLENHEKETEDDQNLGKGMSKPTQTKMLKLANYVDVSGFLAFIILYGFTVQDALTSYHGYRQGNSSTVLCSYASVTVLVSGFLHLVLLSTQLLQLRSTRLARKLRALKCPHCKHMIQNVSPHATTSPITSLSHSQHEFLVQSLLVDADPNAQDVAVDVSSGQQTGVTQKTPTAAEAIEVRRARTGSSTSANESGVGEGDTLIEKSK